MQSYIQIVVFDIHVFCISNRSKEIGLQVVIIQFETNCIHVYQLPGFCEATSSVGTH